MFRDYGVTAGLVAIAFASGIVVGRGARVEAQMQGDFSSIK